MSHPSYPRAAPTRAILHWRQLAGAALGPALVAGLISGALAALDRIAESTLPPTAPPDDLIDASLAQRQADAALLGVSVSATAAEIRAAFRAKMRTSPTIHPDRGGDGAQMRALIEARDRLLADDETTT